MSTAIKEAFNAAFAAASTKERKTIDRLLARVNATDIQHSSVKGYDRWDSKFTVGDVSYVVEIKCRNVRHDAYTETLIEKSKVMAMREMAKKEGREPILIINFTDDVCFQFNLNDSAIDKLGVKSMYCNATTAVQTARIEKQVYLLPFSLGKRIDLNTTN
jgi:hypothetical protein